MSTDATMTGWRWCFVLPKVGADLERPDTPNPATVALPLEGWA